MYFDEKQISFECLFHVDHETLQSTQGQTCHGSINHDIIVGPCSEFPMRLSYYIHRAHRKKFSTLANIELSIVSCLPKPLDQGSNLLLLFYCNVNSEFFHTQFVVVENCSLDLSCYLVWWHWLGKLGTNSPTFSCEFSKIFVPFRTLYFFLFIKLNLKFSCFGIKL